MIKFLIRLVKYKIIYIFLACIALYIGLLFINRNDALPSRSFLDLIQAEEHLDTPPSKENAYIFLMGFSAAPDEDPTARGESYSSKLQDITQGEVTALPDPSKGSSVTASIESIPSELWESLKIWKTSDETRPTRISQDFTRLKQEIKDRKWIIDRYQALIFMQKWRPTNKEKIDSPTPPYRDVLDAQILFLMNAWISASEGDINYAREAIDQDNRFWRMMLSSSNRLLGSMVAIGALRRNYLVGNLAIQSLTSAAAINAIPVSWRVEHPVESASLKLLLGNELRDHVYLFSRVNLKTPLIYSNREDTPLLTRLFDYFLHPLFKRQATLNMEANYYEKLIEIYSAPHKEYEEAFKKEAGLNLELEKKYRKPESYNLMGNQMLRVVVKNHTSDYFLRMADIEGARRLALLTTRLHAERIPTEKIPAVLDSSILRNPYTGKAYLWDEKSKQTIFTGLAGDNERARFAFFYRP